MKIISKFKDFYDYKVAKYGVDEKLVYTRVTKNFRNSPRLFSINKTQLDFARQNLHQYIFPFEISLGYKSFYKLM